MLIGSLEALVLVLLHLPILAAMCPRGVWSLPRVAGAMRSVRASNAVRTRASLAARFHPSIERGCLPRRVGARDDIDRRASFVASGPGCRRKSRRRTNSTWTSPSSQHLRRRRAARMHAFTHARMHSRMRARTHACAYLRTHTYVRRYTDMRSNDQ